LNVKPTRRRAKIRESHETTLIKKEMSGSERGKNETKFSNDVG
jgi:hypothetical protein